MQPKPIKLGQQVPCQVTHWARSCKFAKSCGGGGMSLLCTSHHVRWLGYAHLPQVPARTHSLRGTTGTPCSRLYRWLALAAVGPTEMSALETNAPVPQTASASECPRPRQRWGHCLQGNRDRAPCQCRPSSSKPGSKDVLGFFLRD